MRTRAGAFLIGLAIAAAWATGASATGEVRVVVGGRTIAASDAAQYHCHDGAYPEIRCFTDAAARDADALTMPAARPATGSVTQVSALATFYVTFYQNQNYGGSSYTASQSIADLSAFGWNDIVSSFTSLNGQRPKWWEHANWVPPTWQWAAGATVSYVGSGANDRFTGVANVP